MQLPADKQKYIQNLINNAMHKRQRGQQLIEEAEQELIQARMLQEDFEKGVTADGRSRPDHGRDRKR